MAVIPGTNLPDTVANRNAYNQGRRAIRLAARHLSAIPVARYAQSAVDAYNALPTDPTHFPHLRGGKRKNEVALESPEIKRFKKGLKSSNMPRNTRTTSKRARTSAKKTYRRRRSYKRRYAKKKRSVFSSKGFTLYDKQFYTIDDGTTRITMPGYEDGDTFSQHFCSGYLSTTNGSMNYVANSSGDKQHLYFRTRFSMDHFNSTTGIRGMFMKYKFNWVKMVFNFPDQQADTTNTEFPACMYINYGDMYRFGVDNNTTLGTALPSGTDAVRDFFERPGWKQIFIKRKNSVTVKFKPTEWKKRLVVNATGSAVQRDLMRPTVWHDMTNTSLADEGGLVGPTIAFRFPNTVTNSATQEAIWDGANFMRYVTCIVTASISFKDRNKFADN
jgi:hypothetical protein